MTQHKRKDATKRRGLEQVRRGGGNLERERVSPTVPMALIARFLFAGAFKALCKFPVEVF